MLSKSAASNTAPMASKEPLVLKNVLSQSRSPYVRGHMNNPVAWQMWGPEAIALAKQHNKLLFISIGYAACHWCHVMERESFENQEVANALNSSFIPIKIDREERPDIDRIYMNYVQATNGGRGGWPMNVFITPNLEPVFGGTYWPGPNAMSVLGGGHPGFLGVLDRVKNVWETEPERCLLSAKDVVEQLRNFAQEGKLVKDDEDGPEIELLEDVYDHFTKKFDQKYAGFGVEPKFPTPANLAFLLLLDKFQETVRDIVGIKECENAKSMVVATLRNMTRGGIHDQVGSGFARYSVTKDWSLPHFEKMLYDQGQLLDVYVDAFLVTGDAEILGAVYDIANYLTTPPMAAASGGFYSSEDADSFYQKSDTEKREGAFYVWTRKELVSILGERDADVAGKFYNVKENGNVAPEFDAHDELLNQNVLCISSTPEGLAKEFGLSKDEIVKILKESKKKLLEHRNAERPRPDLDDKIVVAWNGLAIGALSRASSMLQSIPGAERATECRDAAMRAVAFIKKELFDPQSGEMKRVFREGAGTAPAFADDYAYFIDGLIELYEATFDDEYLQFADILQKTQIRLFWDSEQHGFFSTMEGQSDIILRLKDAMDAAEPSTNGVSASNLYRLGSIFEDEEYTSKARKTCEAFATEIIQHPFLYSTMMSSVVAGKLGMKSVVICGNGKEVEEAVQKSRLRLKPNTTVARLGDGAKNEWLKSRNQLMRSMNASKPSVQVCEGGVCTEELQPADADKVLK